jgi:type VI secretion system secreted protein VgrG
MANFSVAIPVILLHEGGLSDVPQDPGGITNYGISIMFTTQIFPLLGVQLSFPIPTTPDGIRALTKDQAVEIYRKCWWDYFHYGLLNNDLIATKIFDMAVNMGPPTKKSARIGPAHEIAQRAANACGADLKVDGDFGGKTLAAINLVPPRVYIDALCKAHADFYLGLIEANPQRFGVFKGGWLKRAADPF